MISSRHGPVQTIALVFLMSLLALSGCASNGNSGAGAATEFAPEEYPGGDILVSAGWLAANIDDPDLRIVDLSPIGTYRDGHIPGAIHVWWQDTIEIHNDVYGMMADAETRSEEFRRAGISDESFVVVYDDDGGRNAARFLWLLHFIGFHDVALLNGGRQAWEHAGYNLSTDSSDPVPGEIEHFPDYGVLIGADDVQAALDEAGTVIVDGRSNNDREETWFGRLRTGQIPGSVRLPRNETTADGPVPYFRSPEELQAMLPDEMDPEDDLAVIAYGLHGVLGGHTYVTLRLLGFESVRLYDGSWAEWGAQHDRPIED